MRGLGVGREVDVVTRHPPKSLRAYRLHRSLACSMIENIGRDRGRELQIDFDAVSLAGADTPAGLVEREPLLVVLGDHALELLARDREVPRAAGIEERIDIDPASRFELKPEPLRLMAEMLAEIFADRL